MKKRLSITKLFDQAKALITEGKITEADETLDWCLVVLSKNSLAGMRDRDLLEGTKMGVWFERVWMLIENNGLLPD
jgi:hypothetical protein